MRRRDIWLCNFAGFLLGIVEFAVIAHLVLYLTESIALSVVTSGVILALTQAGGAVGKPLGGLLSDRLLGSKRRGVLRFFRRGNSAPG